LTSENAHRRASAAEVLGHLHRTGAQVLPDLEKVLQDPNPAVRLQAAIAIWRIDGQTTATVPVLAEGVRGMDARGRASAIQILGEIGAPAAAATPALAAALADRFHFTRRAAAEALGKIGPNAHDALPSLRSALTDEDPEVVREVRNAIENIITPP
jgi:HEAT repeat protein